MLNNIKKNHSQNPFFQSPKISNSTFVIIHTAKDVEYNITGFREKNLDELSNLLLQVSTSSQNPMIQYLFTGQVAEKKDKTLSKKIRTSMDNLMKEL